MATGQDEPDADLATGLVRLARLVQDVFTRTAADHDLTAAQARLLCVLSDGPRTMSELAGVLGVEKAAMTGLIDRIERRGLVQRTTVAGDRRAWRVRLTPTGQKQALTTHEGIIGAIGLLVGGLSQAQQDRLRQAVVCITQDHQDQ